ncbi:hypothetical protein HA402_011161 [Bradysia odoriphaga]|nr:hypothetical protein HA402_011161 [Bradysia odoriphaga]
MAEHRPPYDPGWNDPPTFNYSNAPPPTKTKLNLNKRVAFPMQSSSNSAELPKVEKSTAGLPMPFARVKSSANESNKAPPAINNVPLAPPPSVTNAFKSPEGCESSAKVPGAFETNESGNSEDLVLSTLKEINKSLESTDSAKFEEIEKRLSILEVMWTDGKIDDKLKSLLAKTARALQDNQFSAAIDLQRSIIVDHGANVCAQWGPALRQLILLKESKISPKSEMVPDASAVDEPKFMNPLDEENVGSSKTVGRVKHL